jgi:cyanophycin synthetase
VINYKLVAVARRIPAAVTGNGASTIQQLIDEVNLDSRRGEGHNRELTLIKVDQVTEMILKDKGLTLDSVLPQGEILYLKDTANLSTGGTAEDVTDIVHPENKFLIERAARIIGLDICGIDVIAPSVERPFKENGGMIIEVNAGPGLRMHVSPSMGRPRNVGEAIVNLLYPEGNGRIPVVAITGTNGKTTTTRLVAHLVSQMGYHVGYTVTDGIFIAGHAIDFGDCTGSRSAEVILSDPLVNFAVLECARGGILRHGLGFDSCDIGIVTNVADDHLGLGDINTIEEMAKVKSVVPRSVAPSGYSILNADDDLVYAMASDIVSKLALFSLDANSPRITEHCEKGGLAAVVDNGYITIIDGNKRIQIEKAENIPLTMKGKAIFMIQNVLPAVLVGYINKFPEKEIRLGLMTFHPSVDQTPGRLNVFNFPHFDVLVDYAHNTHGYKALGKFLSSIRDRHKVGIVAAVGDRRDEDIMNVGRLAAEMFDEIIIRQDHDLRGRTVEEIMSLIEQGIKQVRNKPVISIPNELDAIHYAFQNAKNGSMIVICTDMIKEVLDYVKSEHEKYSHEDQYHE